jgi:predicted ATP-binding protein involved in virulence
MYIREIEIENYGPIENLKITPSFRDDGSPKPVILIGQNGGGKSIILSHIVNTLIVAKQSIYIDVEVEKGKVYKVRSPNYIRSGKNYSYSRILFDDGQYASEWLLNCVKSEYEKAFGVPDNKRDWDLITIDQNSLFKTTFKRKSNATKSLIDKACALYFPANRFEEPGWLNQENLLQAVNYTDKKNFSGYSNRTIIAISPLKKNQQWILDILLDRNVLEKNTIPTEVNGKLLNIIEYNGSSNNIYQQLLVLLKTVLNVSEPIRFGIETRRNRQISIMKNNIRWIPNIFQLSTGETLLLNLFFTIIRDFDLTGVPFSSLAEVKGIVVIDEIDAHLHVTMQRDVLPKLIQLFPKVQFVVTSHSPLFLVGMENVFGKDGCTILEIPSGDKVDTEDFAEFKELYRTIENSNCHKRAIMDAVQNAQKPLIFVEGDYDIRYLKKTAELFNRPDLLERFEFRDGDGYGNLDKVWKSLETKVADAITPQVLILYDCDTNKNEKKNGKVTKKIMTCMTTNPIKKGIENLFPVATIEKLENANSAFIDIISTRKERKRGNEIDCPEEKTVNKDEKRNICDWLCEHGTTEDFSGVNSVLDIIEQWIDNVSTKE